MLSHAEVGRRLGISEAAVRQAEERALKIMRTFFDLNGIKLEDVIPQLNEGTVVPHKVQTTLSRMKISHYNEEDLSEYAV